MNSVAFPAFAIVQNDPERLARALRHGVRILGAVSVPVLCGLGALSPVLIPTLFGQQWATTAGLASITTVTAGLNGIKGSMETSGGRSVSLESRCTLSGQSPPPRRRGLVLRSVRTHGRSLGYFWTHGVVVWLANRRRDEGGQDAVELLPRRAGDCGVVRADVHGHAPRRRVPPVCGDGPNPCRSNRGWRIVYLGLSWFLQRETLMELWADLVGALGRTGRAAPSATQDESDRSTVPESCEVSYGPWLEEQPTTLRPAPMFEQAPGRAVPLRSSAIEPLPLGLRAALGNVAGGSGYSGGVASHLTARLEIGRRHDRSGT